MFKNGGHFRLRPQLRDHRHVFQSVFLRDEYRLKDIAPGSLDTVIDIGGHIGTFAVRVAPLAHRVLCYEPMAESYDLLVHNVSRFPSVEAYRMAVAGWRGNAKLFLGKNPMRNSFFPSLTNSREERSLTVECTTLADIFAEHSIERCDLLKIDCEGAEYDILYSLAKEFWLRIQKICMEYHPVGGVDKTRTGEALMRYLATVGHQAKIYPSRNQPQRGMLFSARVR